TAATYTTPATTLADNNATFTCTVTNISGTATTTPATLTVINGHAPTGIILTPVDGTTYQGGSVVPYSASGTDQENGNVPASAFTWEMVFHHHDHTHPFIAPFAGVTNGQFTIPTTFHEDTDVWYRINLTVTDSTGLSTTVFRDIDPVLSTFTVASNVPGIS